MTLSRYVFRAVVGVALTAVAAASQAVMLVGLTSSNEIARIDTANIAGATRTAITGLAAGDRFVGIDSRPKDGLIYGISLSNQIYTVNATTGVASLVAALGTPGLINAALGYGIDFNPVADFGTGASLRLVSSAGNNYAVNASTGAVTLGTNIATGFSAVSYSNTSFFPAAAPASTSLYYIDSNADTLSVATSAFNAPTITLVGALGVDALKANGFEVLGDGSAYAALNVDNGTSLVTGIYGINLATGAATKLGDFNGTLSGLTVLAPIPEPGTVALMLAGLAAVGFIAKRRTQP